MKRKGVCYDVGRVMMGANWRPKFDPMIVKEELEIIRKDLHCNAVRICGLDTNRLFQAAEFALEQGLEVWFSPEMWDRTQEETLEYLIRASHDAESLRKKWPGKVMFSLGSELTLFMKGIVEGENFFQRMNKPSFWQEIKAGKHNQALNAFLERANRTVRKEFSGPVTYFSVPLESIDWGALDFVGVDMYRDARMTERYGEMVRGYLSYQKPVMIGEFGCCTYQGAEKLGGNGFMITFGMMQDYLKPTTLLPKMVSDFLEIPTRVDGHYVRDEGLQARELEDQLRVLDSAGVEGTFVFTFISPNSPYNDDPRFDSDMASFSLVKSYPEKETVEEFARQAASQAKQFSGVDLDPRVLAKFTKNVGRHGVTYPNMSWDPKESFWAVSKYYGNGSLNEKKII